MPIWFIVAMVVAFGWLGYETKLFTVRLPCGATLQTTYKPYGGLALEPMSLEDALRKVRNTVYQCPCGDYSTKSPSAYFKHQDRCWAWGHRESLIMTTNALGGVKVTGARYLIPETSPRATLARLQTKPKCPTYAGFEVRAGNITEPLCGAKWCSIQQDKVYPQPEIEISFDANGAAKDINLTDLATLYPKMVKNFGARIKITSDSTIRGG